MNYSQVPEMLFLADDLEIGKGDIVAFKTEVLMQERLTLMSVVAVGAKNVMCKWITRDGILLDQWIEKNLLVVVFQEKDVRVAVYERSPFIHKGRRCPECGAVNLSDTIRCLKCRFEFPSDLGFEFFDRHGVLNHEKQTPT